MKSIKVDTSEEKKEELQQKLIIYQLLQKRLEELQQHALLLERRFVEIETAKNTVADIEKLSKGSELYFPLGSGVFAKGSIVSISDMMVELGSGIVMAKDPKSVKDFLEGKEKELEKSADELQDEMKHTMEKVNEIAEELRDMSQ